ncbi:hypothetical protein B0H13DRAFT_2512289 [Mycena leptocephala]|nr:hypothetical protein B0H13DRAFT_2512289 [Mycena leptocephala]
MTNQHALVSRLSSLALPSPYLPVMPSRPKESLAEKVLRLEAELKVKDSHIAALRTPSKKHRKLILRPEGQSGRANGYNLQEAMGLKRQKDRFCRLSRISRSYMFKYLNPHKTIQKQGPTRVDKVIKLTWYCVTYRSISHFQGGWPIRDLMKKMLQNSVNSLKADQRAEALAEEEDSNSEEQVVAAPKKKKAGGKSSKSQSDSESDDDEELDWINDEGDSDLDDEGSDDQVVVKKSDGRKLTAFQSQSNRGTKRAVSPNHEDEDEPSKKKKKASRPFKLIKNNSPPDRTGIKVQITKRKQNSAKGKWIIVVGSLVLIRLQHKSSSNQDEERPKKRAKFSDNNSSPPVRRPVKPDRPTHFQIPQQCPKSGCDESVPDSPSDDLSQLFKKCSKLISSADYQQFQLDAIVQDICAHISHENDVLRLETLGRSKGWPFSLDFDLIVTRILSLSSELYDLCTDNDTLDNSIAWFNFLESIDGKIHEFSKYGPKKFTNAARHARCGYFGPQGSAVIVSTICRIFTGVFSHIRRHLSEVIRGQITASPNSFDSEMRKSPPAEIFPLDISHNDTFLHADDIRTASSEFGDMFNWDLEDEDFKLIEQTNLDAAADRTDNHFANYDFSPSPSATSPSPPPPPNKKSDVPAPNHAARAMGPPRTSRKSLFAAVIEPDVTDIELTLDDFPPRGSKSTKSKANTKSEQKTDKKNQSSKAELVIILKHPVTALAVPTECDHCFVFAFNSLLL